MTIDVGKIYGPDTVFLQQAAHLTNGSYIYLERRDALLQYLIVCWNEYDTLRSSHSLLVVDVFLATSLSPESPDRPKTGQD